MEQYRVWCNNSQIFHNICHGSYGYRRARNTLQQRQLKHVIMGAKLWNSLTSKFQIDIRVSQSKFKKEQKYDGPLLFYFIRRRVIPSTTARSSNLKDDIETKTLADFKYSVTNYNT